MGGEIIVTVRVKKVNRGGSLTQENSSLGHSDTAVKKQYSEVKTRGLGDLTSGALSQVL